MAVVTDTIAHMSTSLGPCILTVTYDDITGALDRFRLVTPVEVSITLRRGGGTMWWDARVLPGDHVRAAGGPVRNIDDIATMGVAT